MRVNRFVESYIDAWNHCDVQGIADHLAEDGIYVDVPENMQTTHDGLIDYLNRFFAHNKHRYELIGDILTNGRMVGYQYRSTVTDNNGRCSPPITYSGAEFMTLHGDAAVTIADYYDASALERDSSIGRRGTIHAGKYVKSGLSGEQLAEYKCRLENIMRSDKLYLRSDLTLPKLADAVGCSVNHLSQVINAGLGMSFFDYLNRYRIRHARDLLATMDERHSAILNVAFSSGFNSNSAFYAAFKKHVGQTPAQYRRTRSGKSH